MTAYWTQFIITALCQFDHFLWFLLFIVCYQGMDWDALLAKKLKPPFLPVIKTKKDVSNFDEEFTRLKPVLTLPRKPCVLTAEQQEIFADFDFSFMSWPVGFFPQCCRWAAHDDTHFYLSWNSLNSTQAFSCSLTHYKLDIVSLSRCTASLQDPSDPQFSSLSCFTHTFTGFIMQHLHLSPWIFNCFVLFVTRSEIHTVYTICYMSLVQYWVFAVFFTNGLCASTVPNISANLVILSKYMWSYDASTLKAKTLYLLLFNRTIICPSVVFRMLKQLSSLGS